MANELARHLRRNRTDAERALWRQLRALKPAGFKFRQQVPIDPYIVDFACLSARVIIEVDGATHSTETEIERDQLRQHHLEMEGFRVLRFWNSDIRFNIDDVMNQIVHTLQNTPTLEDTPTPAPPRKGEG